MSGSSGSQSSGKADEAKDFYILVLQLTNAEQVISITVF